MRIPKRGWKSAYLRRGDIGIVESMEAEARLSQLLLFLAVNISCRVDFGFLGYHP